MAIFARRDIQAAVERVGTSLTGQQLKNLVTRLNGTAFESIGAEWESVVLSALCECGRVAHEQDHGGRTRPDVLFRLAEPGSLEFLTDVRSVSDRDLHEKNPYDEFCAAIGRFLQQQGHNSAGLDIKVEHREEGKYGNKSVRLALSPKKEMEAFVAAELGEFLSGIARNPDKDDAISYDKNKVRFSIRYNGREKRFRSGGYISYTVPYSVRNPLTNALIDKGAQLAKSGYTGAKGIIICDGGCDALKERSPISDTAYGCQAIVQGYLRTHPYVLWVLVLRVNEAHAVLSHKTTITVTPRLYWNPKGDGTLFQDTTAAIERMVKHLPEPEATPTNALHWLNGSKEKGQPLGGYVIMRDKTIRISARALTESLAGRGELQTFLENHGFRPSPLNPKAPCFNFFECQITRGNTLQSASVEKRVHQDDDWMVLEYNGPDPAISRFRVPK